MIKKTQHVDADFWKTEKVKVFKQTRIFYTQANGRKMKKRNGIIRSWRLPLSFTFCVYLVGKILL